MSEMLGLDNPGDIASRVWETNEINESQKKKKATISTKTSKDADQKKVDKSTCNTNNIRNFFISSPPDKPKEPTKQLASEDDNNCKAQTEVCIIKDKKETKQNENNSSDEEHKAKSTSEVANSAKRNKQKWSLSWKMSKKSKQKVDGNSDSDFEEISENCDKSTGGKDDKIKDIKSDKRKNKKKDEEKAKSKTKEKENDKGKTEKEKNRSKQPPNEVITVNSEENVSKNTNSPDDSTKNSNNLVNLQCSLKEGSSLPKQGEKLAKHEGSLTPEAQLTEKSNLEKKKNNALDILMNRSRKSEPKQTENTQEVKIEEGNKNIVKDDCLDCNSTELKGKEDSNDCSIALEVIVCTKEDTKEQIEITAAKTSTTNAFDFLMMKKTKNENVTPKTDIPKASKSKSSAFKLKIRASKSQQDSGSEIEECFISEDHLKLTENDHENSQKKHKKKKLQQGNDSKNNANKDGFRSSQEKTSTESVKLSENKHRRSSKKPSKSLDEETKAKMTKIKNKKEKVSMEKSAQLNSVQNKMEEDSNSSVVEIRENTTRNKRKSHWKSCQEVAKPVKHDAIDVVQKDSNSSAKEFPDKPKIKGKKSHHKSRKSKTSESIVDKEGDNSTTKEKPVEKNKNTDTNDKSVITSPGCEDFEVTPARTGLRKRTSHIDYSLVNEFGLIAGDKKEKKAKESKSEKKKKGEESRKDKESIVIGSDGDEVEMVKSYQNDKKGQSAKTAPVPQKLAPIFLKQKPKEKPKSETKVTEKQVQADKSQSNKTSADSKREKPVKILNDEELKAANTAFLSLFASSKTVKTALKPAVLASQQPAPWPSDSHVTQWSEEDQLEKRLEKTEGGLKFKDKDLNAVKMKVSKHKLKLGKITSLYEDVILDKNKKKVQDVETEPFGSAVIKNLLSESSIYFPGIPLKRLYKQYKSKQDENQVQTIGSSQEQKTEETTKEKPKEYSVKEIKEEISKEGKKKRGHSRRTNSTTNDKEHFEKEMKKLKKEKVTQSTAETVVEEKKNKKGRNKSKTSTQPFSEQDEREESTKTIKEKNKLEQEKVEDVYEKQQKSGGSKRKMSTQSDEELNDKQLKKARRRKDKDNPDINEKREVVIERVDSERPRKKRGREEDDDSVKTGKRKSLRKINEKQEEVMEKKVETSQRKKRKTIDDKLEELTTSTSTKLEDSRASIDDKKVDLLWTEKYQPKCSSEVMGNASSVGRLKSWLEAWKIKREKTLRKELELQKKLLAKQKNRNKQDKKSNQGWLEEDEDSDFHLSDEDSGDSDNEGAGLSNAMLIAGPRGSAKTAAVYACAKELGYKVFEVNCSSKRSSKQILSKLEEATQSHLVVTNSTANIAKASSFGGLFANATNNSNMPLSSLMSNELKKGSKDTAKKAGKDVSGQEKDQSGSSLVGGDDSISSRLKLKAISLILFEEVDLVFEDDKGFWSAVTSFISKAKCPIIMTSNDSRVDCEGRYEQLIFKTPSVNLLAAHLQLTAIINNIYVHPNELKALVSLYNFDIRKCILALQFWVTSGGGKTMKWKKFVKQKKNEDKLKEQCVEVEVKSTSQHQELSMLGKDGEESLLLTADDWKAMTRRQTRGCKRGQIQEPEDVDSDFETPRGHAQAVDEYTHTDSMLVESGESRSMEVIDVDTSVAMPKVHYMLQEHVLGLMNNTLGYRHGFTEVLKFKDVTKISTSMEKHRVTQHSQSLGLNLVTCNFPSLLPSLHLKPSANENTTTVTKTTEPPTTNTNVNTLDRSVFDDGSESNEAVSNQAIGTMATKQYAPSDIKVECTLKEINKKINENAETKALRTKTLELFTSLAEDLSFMDAQTTIPELNQYKLKQYGWWHAGASAGLTDDIIKVNRTSNDWWTQDTSVCIRGAMETASLECSYSRYKTIIEMTQASDVDSVSLKNIEDDLPCKPDSTVINLTGLTDSQLSKISSANKLYRTVNSSLPLVTACSRRATCTEYLPTLRCICHSERLREVGNRKRRFLHYLDSTSTMSNSTLNSLADHYLES